MRKFLAVILVLFCAVSSQAKPRVTVRAFEDRTEEGKAPAPAVMDMMVTELSKAGVFDLMERERYDYITEEIRRGQSPFMDPSTAPAIGKVKGVQYIMTGAITLYKYAEKANGFVIPIIGTGAQAKTAYVVLDIRILDTSTGAVVYASDQVGQAKQVAKGTIAAYKGFFIGGYKRETGGILAAATRDAVMKHVAALKAHSWE
ncbi:MAG: hypothetical protein II954_03670 [Synergistaceae bacterium]|nr:hypothetical protein [Synergistaceae bacterium]